MFEPEWMDYFRDQDPFAYYCLLFLQFLGQIISCFSYLILLLILFVPLFMIYSGTKAIKIKFVEDKKYKKLRKTKKKNEEHHEALYLNHLDNNLKKKKKSKHS